MSRSRRNLLPYWGPVDDESGVLQGAGDEMGEFIFIKVDVHVQGVPKDKVKVKVNVIPEERSDTVSTEPVTPQPQKSEPKAGEKRYIMPIPTL